MTHSHNAMTLRKLWFVEFVATFFLRCSIHVVDDVAQKTINVTLHLRCHGATPNAWGWSPSSGMETHRERPDDTPRLVDQVPFLFRRKHNKTIEHIENIFRIHMTSAASVVLDCVRSSVVLLKTWLFQWFDQLGKSNTADTRLAYNFTISSSFSWECYGFTELWHCAGLRS